MNEIFKSFKKREVIFTVCSIFVTFAQVWLDLKIPDYMATVTRLVQTPGSSMSEIINTGGLMLLCSIGGLLLTFIVSYFAAQIAATVAMRLREKVYKKTLSFSLGEMNDFSTASLITRTTNDITLLQAFIALGYVAIVRAPIMAVWAITKIAGKNPTFTVVTAIGIVVLLVVIITVLVMALPKSKVLQTLTDKLNLVTREQLQGVRVVRAYNAQDYQKTKFAKVNEQVTKSNIFINRATAFVGPFMMFLMSALTLSIYWIGVYLINSSVGPDKLLIFSDMVVFSSYALQIVIAFMMLTISLVSLPRTVVAANRIKEVINSENKIVNGEGEKEVQQEVSVEFKNVQFSYHGGEEAILNDISFKVNKGETVAFIGSTGSGKSTLINLIPRFFDCTKGEILVDGINVKDYNQEALRDKIGLVTQKAILFSGTIASNIAFGEDDYDEKRLETAVDIAQAKDFVDKVGFDGDVSQGGLNLSGGQKQRVSIARAIYKDPEIYIFDDCFSALDYKTDKKLRQELDKHTKNSTKIMVAQRISTIKDANCIFVLNDGGIVGRGTHNDLLSNCEVYREIAESQLSKEELGYE